MKKLIGRFLRHLDEERGFSAHTVRAYQRDLERFLQFLAVDFLSQEPSAIRPDTVDALAVRSFLASQARAGLGPQSCRGCPHSQANEVAATTLATR